MAEMTCGNCGQSTTNLNTISFGKNFVEEHNGICQKYQEKIFTCEICGSMHTSTVKVGAPYKKNKKHKN